MLAFPRRAINSPKRQSPILSPACNLSGLGEKPVASVVWRSGGALHADPHLPACVGVAPLGMEPGLVFNHSPGSIQARWETLSVKQDSCLWWRVRVADTAPNAPNCMSVIDRIPQIACRSLTEFPKLHVHMLPLHVRNEYACPHDTTPPCPDVKTHV